MTPEEIARRNKANAAKSTGPRTRAGKAIVAQNARRHGATSKPPADSVLPWLRIIIAQPDTRASDLLLCDEGLRVALALAEAEARHVAAEQALRSFETGEERPPISVEELIAHQAKLVDLIPEAGTAESETMTGIGLLGALRQVLEKDSRLGGSRHRLLKRYAGEARARRKKAFDLWLSYEAEQSMV